MIRVLVNDGIHPAGQKRLEEAGYEVITEKVTQDQLPNELPAFNAILVRSATKVREDLIDLCPNLKVIGRGGVGLDNIDVDYAKSKGIEVVNTPAASSESVAELVFAHLFGLARGLHDANRQMPSADGAAFKSLKKSYSKGFQLRGKTIGIIGFGRIGQETARIAYGLGMQVLPVDPFVSVAPIEVQVGDQAVTVQAKTVSMAEMLASSDVISLHVPSSKEPILGTTEFQQMKDGVVVVNAARGGVVDEDALLDAMSSGKVASAGLDVFVNEPTPRADILTHKDISLSPHIGASTLEAQEKIGLELADKVIAVLGTA
jgi:D-3-phosphoglycerate dehydrogenase